MTADLESLITKDGKNEVYMAAWYNGKESNIFDLTQFKNSNAMLSAFWFDLISNNRGATLYFHNWAGYDSILSLLPLFNLHEHGFTFNPVMQDGQLISLTIFQRVKDKRTTVLTIKDSLKLIPGALSILAKDFQVETQKDHFPHYFNPIELHGSLNWTGPIPEYQYFEPKRTTPADYAGMLKEFKDKDWNFLKVSKKYILSDVLAQYQIIIKFFKTLKSEFPINPIKNLSIPGLAFTTWKTVQLPLLNKDGFKVYDLSRSSDPLFREAYLGGIVDVYKPHLIGKAYYYDVNSLYPFAMCQPMPVGIPTPLSLTPNEFKEGSFFGFLEATIQAPSSETPAGYIGLLPIKLNGRVICPGGVFSGSFFSEELQFALQNGYELLQIGKAFSFQRGDNTFKALIERFNLIKINAQLDGRPVLRQISKLIMNSLYGRFGMHTPELQFAILKHQEFLEIMNDYLVLDNVTLGDLELVTYALDKSLLNFEDNKEIIRLRKFLKGIPGQTNVPIEIVLFLVSCNISFPPYR